MLIAAVREPLVGQVHDAAELGHRHHVGVVVNVDDRERLEFFQPGPPGRLGGGPGDRRAHRALPGQARGEHGAADEQVDDPGDDIGRGTGSRRSCRCGRRGRARAVWSWRTPSGQGGSYRERPPGRRTRRPPRTGGRAAWFLPLCAPPGQRGHRAARLPGLSIAPREAPGFGYRLPLASRRAATPTIVSPAPVSWTYPAARPRPHRRRRGAARASRSDSELLPAAIAADRANPELTRRPPRCTPGRTRPRPRRGRRRVGGRRAGRGQPRARPAGRQGPGGPWSCGSLVMVPPADRAAESAVTTGPARPRTPRCQR